MASKYITELLSELNDNPELVTTQYRRKGPGDTLFSSLIEAAFDPAKAFILPTTRPPYRPNPRPIGLSESNLMAEVSRFYIYRSTSLTRFKRETLFLQALERVSAQEAEILLAIKDQNLTSLYPNLTPQLMCDAGYIPQDAVKPLENAQKGLIEVKKANGVVIVTKSDIDQIGANLLAGITPPPPVPEYLEEKIAPPTPKQPEAPALSMKEQCRQFYEASSDKSKETFMAFGIGVLGLGKAVSNNYYYAIRKEIESKNPEAPLGA